MYEIEFTECKNYLKVVVIGVRTALQRKDGADAWIKIADYCRKNHTKKLLLISKLTGKIDPLSSFDISNSFDFFEMPKQLKIAFVEENELSREINSFSSEYPSKKGYTIKVFDGIDKGISWLG